MAEKTYRITIENKATGTNNEQSATEQALGNNDNATSVLKKVAKAGSAVAVAKNLVNSVAKVATTQLGDSLEAQKITSAVNLFEQAVAFGLSAATLGPAGVALFVANKSIQVATSSFNYEYAKNWSTYETAVAQERKGYSTNRSR